MVCSTEKYCLFGRKCKDGFVYQLLSKYSYITYQIGAIYGHAIEMRPKRQHTRKMGYGGVTNATLRSNNQLLQQQPHAHTVEGCCC